MRLDQAKRDRYRRIAKREGYRSRASFKLIQMDKKYKLFKPKHIVVDFGSAPGGWLQYLSKAIGTEGFALGIDLKPVKPIAENVKTFVTDIKNSNIEDKIIEMLPKKADVVTSDLSQSLSGIWELDVARQIDLTSKVVELFPSILEKGGSSILKVFQGEGFDALLDRLKKDFKSMIIVKPPASRPQSSEVYLLCRGYADRL
ncbi:MAG: RlmE family RNA methyltransferase [Candidatus Methylarchaceae archaeon HK01B]|nr:RlmE family RNA methyltransferase [Candidatus Methylarchaceae archaeon HK01M]MCP8311407.1 RlmE family RNA methyltransferase [Candidatus Methylarchaceae archaeon HK02M1]MCP8318339.1 RlmE family RNA methyltransferase [Candidatus Methylarchaceae archaeon HK01B]